METGVLIAILVLAHGVETATGFGATVIALALGVHLVPLQELVLVLVMIAWLQSAWIMARSWRATNWRLLLATVLPLAALGTGLGIAGRAVLPAEDLRLLLGLFVVGAAALELWRLRRGMAAQAPLPRTVGGGLLAAGGIFHGLFATGGPLVVYVLSRAPLDKQAFRATLSALWLALNTGLLVSAALSSQLDRAIVERTALLLPGLFIGIAIGEVIHRRAPELFFRRAVQVVLACTGLSLLT